MNPLMGSNIIDITPVVSSKIGVFPGDVTFKRKISLDFKNGQNLLLSSVESTLHLGAHADAPNHYDPKGAGIDERALEPYLGRCLVLEARAPRGARIGLEHLAEKWRNIETLPASRILVKTGSFPDPNSWNSDFCSFQPALIEHLAGLGARLIGIDTPSIDPEDSKDLPSHKAVARHDLSVLEGLVLQSVPEGLYTLVALPLKLAEADAAPVRAVLIRDIDGYLKSDAIRS